MFGLTMLSPCGDESCSDFRSLMVNEVSIVVASGGHTCTSRDLVGDGVFS